MWLDKLKYNKITYSQRAMEKAERLIVLKANKYNIPGYTSEDLAQELRIHLWDKLEKYHPVKAGLDTWLNRVLSNHLINMSVRAKRKNRDILDDPRTLRFSEIPEVPDDEHE